MSETLREKLARLSDEQVLSVTAEVEKSVREFFPNNKMSFPAEMIIVTGTKL
jgi:hypothetical protein